MYAGWLKKQKKYLFFQIIFTRYCIYIETSHSILSLNQIIGFYITATLVKQVKKTYSNISNKRNAPADLLVQSHKIALMQHPKTALFQRHLTILNK